MKQTIQMSVSSWYFGQDSNNIHGHLPQVTWDGLVPQPATWLAQRGRGRRGQVGFKVGLCGSHKDGAYGVGKCWK